jgi:8-oxo-dGTP diphosphatase
MKTKLIPASDQVDLRRGVDHIGVTVCAIVHDGKGRILMMKRGPKARDENGRWDIVGGALEFGERLEDAVAREIQEELLADALDIQYVHTYEAHREHNGVQTHWIALTHIAKVDPSTVKIGEPHKKTEIGWFGVDNLPEPRHSMFQHALDVAKRTGVIK